MSVCLCVCASVCLSSWAGQTAYLICSQFSQGNRGTSWEWFAPIGNDVTSSSVTSQPLEQGDPLQKRSCSQSLHPSRQTKAQTKTKTCTHIESPLASVMGVSVMTSLPALWRHLVYYEHLRSWTFI